MEEKNVGKEPLKNAQEKKEKGKRKERKARETNKGDSKLRIAMISFVVAILLFMVLLTVQNHFLNGEEKAAVVVAIQDVPDGLLLTEEIMPEYFAMELRSADEIPETAFRSGQALAGMVVINEIPAKSIITGSSVTANDYSAEIEDPVELSIDVTKLGQAVAGTLRAGDRIDIQAVFPVYQTQAGSGEPAADVAVSGISPVESVQETAPDVQTEETVPEESTDAAGGQDAVENVQGTDQTGGTVLFEDAFATFFDTFAAASGVQGNVSYSLSGRYLCMTVAEDVTVTNVYTSAGEDPYQAAANGNPMVATVITVVVPRALQDTINMAMEEGTIRIARLPQAQDGGEEIEIPAEEEPPAEERAEETPIQEDAVPAEPAVSETEESTAPLE